MQVGEFAGLAVNLARHFLQAPLRFGAGFVVHQFADGLEVMELGLRHHVKQRDGASGMLHAAAGVTQRGFHLLAAVHHHEKGAVGVRKIFRDGFHGLQIRRKAALAAQPALAASRIATKP